MAGVTLTRISHRGSAAGTAGHGSGVVGPDSFRRYDAIPRARLERTACRDPYAHSAGAPPRLTEALRLARRALRDRRVPGETGTGRRPLPHPFQSHSHRQGRPVQAASAAAHPTHPRTGKSGPFHNLATRGGNQ